MKPIQFALIAVIGILALAGCNTEHNHEENQQGAHDEHDEPDKEEVHMVQQQMDVMNIEMGNFQSLNLSTTIRANGNLDLPPQNKASISSMVGGKVKDVFVIVGDEVKVGQILALIQNPEILEMQENYLDASSQFEYLQKDFERKQSLFRDSISSKKSFEQAQAKYLSAKGRLSALRQKLLLIGVDVQAVDKGKLKASVPVRSPINGFVQHVLVNIGKFVSREEEMFEVLDNDFIHIDLMVYEMNIGKVQKGQEVVFSLANKPDLVFRGSIFAVGKSFEQKPKAVVVHAKIENKTGDLLPGMYVDARIITDTNTARVLPDEAIVSDAGLDYIFVLKAEDEDHHDHEPGDHHDHSSEEHHDDEYIFHKIEVNTGVSDLGFTEVVVAEQIPDNPMVVTKGAYYLLAEMKKGAGGHGHHH